MASRNCGEAVEEGVNGWLLDSLEPEEIAEAIRAVRPEQLSFEKKGRGFGLDELGESLASLGD